MTYNNFTENSPGTCSKAEHESLIKKSEKFLSLSDIANMNWEYLYFIPNNLPPIIEYPSEIYLLLSQADKLIGELSSLSDFVENNTLLVYPYLSREATFSSQMEGTQSTIRDYWIAETREINNKIPFDVIDIQNYIKVIEYSYPTIQKDSKISFQLLFDMHKILFKNKQVKGLIGEITNAPNYIRDKKIKPEEHNLRNAKFVFPEPAQKRKLLNNWIDYFNNDTKEPILIKCALLHYQFEVIHPFSDGNGRIGRILILLFLYFKGWLSKPLLHLSGYFLENKNEYMEKLLNISTNGEWINWIEYFLNGIICQSKIAILEAKEIIFLIKSYKEKIKKIETPVMIELINGLLKNPFISISNLSKEKNYNYNTVKSNVIKLEKIGILQKYDKKKERGILYYCEDLKKILMDKGFDEEEFRSVFI